MKRCSKWFSFLCCVLGCLCMMASMKTEAATDTENQKEENPYASGISIFPYDNNGKKYSEWWYDSELNVAVSNIPVQISKGVCTITAYLPDSAWKDGNYALEVFLEGVNNRAAGTSQKMVQFEIKNGRIFSSDFNYSVQPEEPGYLFEFALNYDYAEVTKDYNVMIKLHTDYSGKNGAIYFANMKFEDEKFGTAYVDFADDKLTVSAKKYSNSAKISVTKEKYAGLKVFDETESLFIGDTYRVYTFGMDKEADLKYISSDEKIATVSKDGIITAKSAGKVTITVTDSVSGASDTVSVVVVKADVPELFSSGIAVTPYNNGGKEYNDWWNESEICAYIEDIPVGIIRGGYGVSAYIQDYTLKDGSYGIGVSLCKSKSPYDYFSYSDSQITIRNGVLDVGASEGVFRRVANGYLLDLAGGYVQNEVNNSFVIVLKVHSTVTGTNGNIYFGDLFFADALSGFSVIDLTEKGLTISASRLSTDEELDAKIKKLSDDLVIVNATGTLYTGETLELNVQTENATEKLIYSSSNNKVLTVTDKGKLTAKKAGEAVITIKDESNSAEISFRVTVADPYIVPVVEKKSILLGTSYQFSAVGYGMENAEFSWTSSDRTVGTIDAKSGKFDALKKGTTTITLSEQKSGKKYSFELEVYEVSNSDLEKYISIETNGLISSEMEERVTKLLYEVYPKVFDYFADGKYAKVTCTFDNVGGVAYTIGKDMYIDVNYINSNPKDIDCITHELIHCAQSYNTYDQVWLIEGITDYGRSLFGLYNKEANWSLDGYAPGQSYTDSYRVTGGFLKYVVENHNNNIVDILNKQLKQSACPDSIWYESTGYTIDELWELYSKNK